MAKSAIRWLWPGLLGVALALGCAKRPPASEAAQEPKPFRLNATVDSESARRLRSGEYLSDRYMHRLVETRSPAASSTEPEPCLIWVQQNEDCSTNLSVGDFYSSLGWLFLKEDDSIETYAKVYTEGRFAFRAIGTDHFVLSFGQFEEMNFQYIREPELWAERLLVSDGGETGDGRPYSLTPDGQLKLGPVPFTFKPCLDYRNYTEDCLWLDDCLYSASFRAPSLRIFEVLQDASVEEVEEPEVESAKPEQSR